jgi:hypothetical protein
VDSKIHVQIRRFKLFNEDTTFVSVIIVSYNTRDLTLTCLKHVYTTTGLKSEELEVIVVDNHSSDGTVAAIKSKYPQVKIVASRANLGFGAGNNLGAKQAQGEYLLLLNTDAYLSATTLSRLVKTIQSNDQISAVGPGYHYEDGSFQQSAGYFPTPWAVVGWMWGFDKLPLIKYLFASPYHLYDARWYVYSRPVDWLMGACVLLKRADFLRVGGFDENFYVREEVELFQRLSQTTGRSTILSLPHRLFILAQQQKIFYHSSLKRTQGDRIYLSQALASSIMDYPLHHLYWSNHTNRAL